MNYRELPFYQEMNLDTLFRNAWEIYKKNFGWFFLISFIFVMIIQYFTNSIIGDYMQNLTTMREHPELLFPLLKKLGLALAIMVPAYTLLYVFLFYSVLNPVEKDGKSYFELFMESLKYFLPVLGATILAGLIFFVGSMLGIVIFIVGVLIAMLFFAVIFFPLIPIVINENSSPGEAIMRCFRLVYSDFWKTVGWVLAFLAIYFAASGILSLITMIPQAGNFLKVIGNPESANNAQSLFQSATNPLSLILSSAVSAIILPFQPIFSVLLYLNLKHKEDQTEDRAEIMQHFR